MTIFFSCFSHTGDLLAMIPKFIFPLKKNEKNNESRNNKVGEEEEGGTGKGRKEKE